MITEIEIVKMLQAGQISLPPMHLKLYGEKPKINNPYIRPDAFVEGTWSEQNFKFIAEIKRYSSPKMVSEAINSVLRACSIYRKEGLNFYPLVITPWLSPEILNDLEKENVSGVDLNGNGVIVVPDSLLIFRTGYPNGFTDSRLVRNVYDGRTSIVARAFLARPRYESAKELLTEIRARNGSVSQSTVSKALRQLENDLILTKDEAGIRLLQPDKLLDRLAAEYKLPQVSSRLAFKAEFLSGELLTKAANKVGAKIMMTGSTGVDRVAVFAREPIMSFYCDVDPLEIAAVLTTKIDINSKFPAFELMQTDEPSIFFDSKQADDKWMVPSIVQVWLDLSRGDKRQKEVATLIKKKILDDISAKKVLK